MKKAVIVLPTYNEKENIKKLITLIDKVRKEISNWQIDILVVDSHSPDGTINEVKKLQKEISNLHFLETKKEGLGKAYINGFQYAIEKLKAYVIFEMDADLSHDPKLIPLFLKEIEKGADFVIGSRYIKGGSIPKDWSFDRKLFSVLGNLIIKFGFMKLKITDWTSGFRAIKTWVVKEALSYLKNYSGYVFQVAFLDYAIKNGAKINEVPLNFVDRKWGKSKINSFQYIIQTLIYVFLNSSFIKFVIVGVIGFIIDMGILYLLVERLHIATKLVWLAQAISAETAIVSNFLLNNFWSFAYKKIKDNHFLSFIKFNFVSLGSLLIQTIGLQLLVNFFGRELWFLYKVLIIAFIIIPYSYILYNKVIWKEK
jgi:dolichol-phosphate mannosyltransferase